jgi:hypothetical protein
MINNVSEAPEDNKTGTLIFHEADPDKNIFEDPKYLELDRIIRFETPSNGITVSIARDNLGEVPSEQRAYVAVVCDFINNAIEGKHEELNAMFSDQYVDAGGELKLDFTMQQLYDIKITYIETSTSSEESISVTSYDYWLEYKIRQNNGTFRHDIESDCSKKEYIRISNRNEDYSIDVLAPYRTVNANNTTISSGDITILVIISAVILILLVVITIVTIRVFNSKKSSK